MLEKNNMLKRLVYLFQQLMKKNSLFCIAALTVVIAALFVSCSNEPVIEYDVDHIDGKWIVESTTGKITIMSEYIFEPNDTVRFIKKDGFGFLYISRAGKNERYVEIEDIHYFVMLGYTIDEDKKTFHVVMFQVDLFDIIESRKGRLVIQHRDTGIKVRMKRLE